MIIYINYLRILERLSHSAAVIYVPVEDLKVHGCVHKESENGPYAEQKHAQFRKKLGLKFLNLIKYKGLVVTEHNHYSKTTRAWRYSFTHCQPQN
jgi:hypothetical protein